MACVPRRNTRRSRRLLHHEFIKAGEDAETTRTSAERQRLELWYSEGMAKYFAAGGIISLPVDSVEVKSEWTPISEADKPRYHWNLDS